MKIQRNFYSEMKEEFEQCTREEGLNPSFSPKADRNFLEYLQRTQKVRRLCQSVAGGNISKEAFQHIVDKALNLADCIGLDFLAEIHGALGEITLSSPSFRLDSLNDASHIASLIDLLSTCRFLQWSTTEKNEENHVCLSLYYDLFG